MRQVKYFVAMSLDAYIARPDGGVKWLFTDQDYGMREFFSRIDTCLIGRKTYEFMLSRGSESYPGLTNVVFSRTLDPASYPEVAVVADDPAGVVKSLKAGDGKDIWLVGGGRLFRSLLEAGSVDAVIVAVHPVLLGEGIPMLSHMEATTELTLAHVTPYDTGLVTLHYTVRRASA